VNFVVNVTLITTKNTKEAQSYTKKIFPQTFYLMSAPMSIGFPVKIINFPIGKLRFFLKICENKNLSLILKTPNQHEKNSLLYAAVLFHYLCFLFGGR